MLIFEMFAVYTCGHLSYLVGNDGSVTWQSSCGQKCRFRSNIDIIKAMIVAQPAYILAKDPEEWQY